MKTIFTIGHSTRTTEALLSLLHEHGIALVVDVRRFPASRRHPQLAREPLAAALEAAGVRYRHEPDLGGRRTGRKDSPHTAWRNAAFRAYADYMETPAFRAALARVIEESQQQPTAVICAEAHPSQCHRRLIADAALARGVPVVHVIAPGRSETHVLNPEARVGPDGGLVYEGSQPTLPGLARGDF